MIKNDPFHSAMSKLRSNEMLTEKEKSEIIKYMLELESENNTLENKVNILNEAIKELIHTLKVQRILK